MATPANATKEAVLKGPSSLASMVGDWIRQGTEGFIATQKILLDLTAQQNALALTIARERLGLISPTPSKTMVDLTAKTVHNFMEAQQALLDIAAKENDIIAEGVKPSLENTAVEGLAEVIHQGLANCITAQKHFLSFLENETNGTVIDYGHGKPFDTGRLSDIAREGVRRFIKAQKKFLDIIERELVEKKEEPEGEKTTKPVNLFDIAKDSVDAYVETQKHLLDLASDQVSVNVRFVRELFNVDIQKRPHSTIPDVLKKSADSFVAAQKALVELASKPRKPVENHSGGLAARA